MTAAPERSHWLLPFQPDSGGHENLPVCRIAETFRPDWSKQANSQTMKYRPEFPDLSLARSRIVISPMIPQDSPSCYHSAKCNLLVVLIHLYNRSLCDGNRP